MFLKKRTVRTVFFGFLPCVFVLVLFISNSLAFDFKFKLNGKETSLSDLSEKLGLSKKKESDLNKPPAKSQQGTVTQKPPTTSQQRTTSKKNLRNATSISFWQGKFTCNKRSSISDMMFRFTPTTEGQVLKGILKFAPTWRNSSSMYSNSGSLKMQGTLDSGTGQFQLQPKGWLAKSPRQPFSINGVIAKDGKTMSGRTSDKYCTEFSARRFEISLPPINPNGLLFKAKRNPKSLTDNDCLAYARWVNSGEEIELPEGRIMSQILDDEGMRQMLGKTLFQWRPKEDRDPYREIFIGCRNKSSGTFNMKLSDEASLVKYWNISPLDDRSSMSWGALEEQSYLAVYDATALRAEQKALANALPQKLKSLATLKSLLAKNRKKYSRIAWLPKVDLKAHQAFLAKRQSAIARKVVDKSIRKLQTFEDSEKGLDSLQAYHAEAWKAFKSHLSQAEILRYKQAYSKAMKGKGGTIILARLPAKTAALANFKDGDLNRLKELKEIDDDIRAIREFADLNDPKVKQVVNAYNQAYGEAWTAVVDKSILKIQALAEDSETDSGSLQAYYKETWSVLQPYLPEAEAQRFKQTYSVALREKERNDREQIQKSAQREANLSNMEREYKQFNQLSKWKRVEVGLQVQLGEDMKHARLSAPYKDFNLSRSAISGKSAGLGMFLFQAGKKIEDDVKTSSPYQVRVTDLTEDLERGEWYAVSAEVLADFEIKDSDGLLQPILSVQTMYKCEKEKCLEFEDVLSLVQVKYDEPDWQPTQAREGK